MAWLDDRILDLLPALSLEARARLVQASRRTQLAKAQTLLAAGDRWRHLWLAESGALRLYYLDLNGTESNKNFFLEGQPLWPITDWLRTEPVTFFVAAMEPSIVHEFDMDEVERLVGEEPSWQSLRLHALQQLLTEKMWREQLLLQYDACGRYQQLRAHRLAWCQRISLRHQASWLGMTDVSLSRVRARLGLV